MRNEKVKLLSISGMFAAMIFVATWAVHVPAGVNGGYIHFGDALAYLAAALLPAPYAMAAAAVGAGLSDFLSPGGAVWIIPTILIKPLCCRMFTGKGDSILCRRNLLGAFYAGVITIAGYFFATVLIGGFGAAVAELAFSWVQPVGSGFLFLAAGAILDKAGVKHTTWFTLKEDRL